MYKTALMPDNVWIFLPLLLHGIAVMLGLCLCHLAAPRQSATDPRRAGAERPDRPRRRGRDQEGAVRQPPRPVVATHGDSKANCCPWPTGYRRWRWSFMIPRQ